MTEITDSVNSRNVISRNRQNLLDDLIELLQSEQEFVSDGAILKNVVIEAALNMNPRLLKLLMQSEAIKEYFFTKVEGVFVFDKVKFQDFVSKKTFLPDSYTVFKNRIGLVDRRGDYLSQSHDVVLAWPYKDCVLEGGMTKEDQVTEEVFWNTILSPDDITRLFEPKILTGWERWDAEAVANDIAKPVSEVSEEDNLLIKGNNLLALHSLKARYAGKVKLIYIDPPYNTGDDGFKYNDRFNHSTWLTFMRNRLDVAKDLLSRDGAIFVNMDYNEVHYLKVLMDEIFGRDNFQREIIWRIGWLSGYKTSANNFIRNHDTVLFYSKEKDSLGFHKKYISQEHFRKRFTPVNEKDIRAKLMDEGLSKASASSVLSLAQMIGLPDRYPIEDTWNCSIYDDLNSVAVVSYSGEKVSKQLGVETIKGQKSEALLKRIIESVTEEGDLVLDFFFGTGTTGAVAQKLGRRWIGIEQMDYINHTTIERIKKVIEGSQVGISKAVGWKGGGSFVYAELAESNSRFISQITAAENTVLLKEIYSEINNTGYLRHDVDFSGFDTDKFADLPLNDAKIVLIECLDHNHLYINLGSLGDTGFDLSTEDASTTRLFYGIQE